MWAYRAAPLILHHDIGDNIILWCPCCDQDIPDSALPIGGKSFTHDTSLFSFFPQAKSLLRTWLLLRMFPCTFLSSRCSASILSLTLKYYSQISDKSQVSRTYIRIRQTTQEKNGQSIYRPAIYRRKEIWLANKHMRRRLTWLKPR